MRSVSSCRGCLGGDIGEAGTFRSVDCQLPRNTRKSRGRKSDRAKSEQTRNAPSALFSGRVGEDADGFRGTRDRVLLSDEVSHDGEFQDEIKNRRVIQDYRGSKERIEGPHEGEGPHEEVVQEKHCYISEDRGCCRLPGEKASMVTECRG